MKEVIDNLREKGYYNLITVTDETVDYNLTLRFELKGTTVYPEIIKYDKLTTMIDTCNSYKDSKSLFYLDYTAATRRMQLELTEAIQREVGLYDVISAINAYSKPGIADYCKHIHEIVFINRAAGMCDEFIAEIPYKPVYERNMIIAVCKHLSNKMRRVDKTA